MLIPLQTNIPGYRCPCDEGQKRIPRATNFRATADRDRLATSNYVAAESSWNIFNADNTTLNDERDFH